MSEKGSVRSDTAMTMEARDKWCNELNPDGTEAGSSDESVSINDGKRWVTGCVYVEGKER